MESGEGGNNDKKISRRKALNNIVDAGIAAALTVGAGQALKALSNPPQFGERVNVTVEPGSTPAPQNPIFRQRGRVSETREPETPQPMSNQPSPEGTPAPIPDHAQPMPQLTDNDPTQG